MARTRAVIAALLAAALAAPAGWRNDGTGVWPGTGTPATWTEGSLAWSTPTVAWSNAQPVPWGRLVCVAEEPVTVLCVTADTGAVAWRATHPVHLALAGDEAMRVRALVDDAGARAAKVEALKAAYGEAMKEARRGTDVGGRLQELGDDLAAARASLDEATRWATLPTEGLVGWSAPTPVADASGLYALFGHGVIAAHTPDGTVRWRRWLGERPATMVGYEGGGHASSPVLAGGVLVAPYGHLTGLDPATGRVRWQHEEPWRHYGTPGVLDVGGVSHVLTPDGRAVRASDGAVVLEGLGDAWYQGPLVRGDTAIWVEARSDAGVRERGGVSVRAARFTLAGGKLAAASLWSVVLPVERTFYAPPAWSGDRLYAVTHQRDLLVIDATSGRVISTTHLDALDPYAVFAAPVVAGGTLYLANEAGTVAALTATDAPRLLGTSRLEPTRSAIAVAGRRVYLRTRDRLVAAE